MQTRLSIPVIYCRVKGEETRRQEKDRREEEEERRSRGGGGGFGGKGECRGGGENEEGYFQREQVKAQKAPRNTRAATWLNKSLSRAYARLSCQSQGFLLLHLFQFYPAPAIQKRNSSILPHFSAQSYPLLHDLTSPHCFSGMMLFVFLQENASMANFRPADSCTVRSGKGG